MCLAKLQYIQNFTGVPCNVCTCLVFDAWCWVSQVVAGNRILGFAGAQCQRRRYSTPCASFASGLAVQLYKISLLPNPAFSEHPGQAVWNDFTASNNDGFKPVLVVPCIQVQTRFECSTVSYAACMSQPGKSWKVYRFGCRWCMDLIAHHGRVWPCMHRTTACKVKQWLWYHTYRVGPHLNKLCKACDHTGKHFVILYSSV